MLSTFDCCPVRFMSACALDTWTEIPPCGGGYGPTKSTFINKSPAPQLERDQRPELQIQRAAPIVQFDEALDVRFSKQSAIETPARKEQVTNIKTELAAEPA